MPMNTDHSRSNMTDGSMLSVRQVTVNLLWSTCIFTVVSDFMLFICLTDLNKNSKYISVRPFYVFTLSMPFMCSAHK